jgi:UDP-N-acetylmuramoyl-tripeptide--D-alanyl-D-alanine ligase
LGILKIFNGPEDIINEIENFKPLPGRLRIFERNFKNKKVYIFDDTYNASPASYFYLLNLAKKLNGKKIGIFADVLEVDNFAKEIHEKIISLINEAVDFAILIGPRMKIFSKENIKIPNLIFEEPDYDKIYDSLNENFDFIFIKGSRGFHLENIVKKFDIDDVVNCFCEYRKNFHNIKYLP